MTIDIPDQGLVVDNISKTIGKKIIVDNISLRLNPGEIVGLLGSNGAGKTTTFYMIMGLDRPDRGKITLGTDDITAWPMYRRARMGLGYLAQEPSVFRGLNVEDNINAILQVCEQNTEKRRADLETLLKEFAINHLRHASVLSLSGGERRRVEIARCLASKPKYLMLDEPLAGIDPVSIDAICQLISHLKSRGIGILLTDHNARETLKIVDRAYIFHAGRVLVEGSVDTIIRDKHVRRLYLGENFAL